MVGGPFFEEVWYAPGSPFPQAARCCRSNRRRRAWPTISRSMPASSPMSIGPRGAVAGDDRHQRRRGPGTSGRRSGAEGGGRRRAKGPRRKGLVAHADLDGARHGRDQERRARRRRRGRRDHHGQSRPVQDLHASRGRTTTTAAAAAASARAWRAPSASRWPIRSGRSSACRATARRCIPSRRCGRRRTTTCRSCS
mgnify:CR=1 FL=1